LCPGLIKDIAVFEKYGAETGGEYTQVRVTVSLGGGTQLHYHASYEEHMMPQKGTLGVVLGEERKLFEPGEKAIVPIGTSTASSTLRPPPIPAQRASNSYAKSYPHTRTSRRVFIFVMGWQMMGFMMGKDFQSALSISV
jgi:hypothetical protein